MTVNRANMEAFFQTLSVKFNAGMAAAAPDVPNLLKVEELAMLFPVSGSGTVHGWLNQVPGMKEWVGDRMIKLLGLGKLEVTNRDFESTVEVPRNDIEDDNYGVYGNLAQSMGASADRLWIQLALQALLANSNWADGNPFFCQNRKLGDNGGVITNVTTAALTTAAVEAGLAAMLAWTLHEGQNAEVTPRTLVVGPSLLATAKQIIEALLISDGTATVSNVSTATMLKARYDSRLIGEHAGKWYIMAEKDGIQPVAVQQRKKPVFTALDKDTDANVFMQNKFLYGTDARGEGFTTLPFLAYAGGFAAGDIADAG